MSQKACFWALLSIDLCFLYTAPSPPFGIPNQNLIGHSLFDLIHPEEVTLARRDLYRFIDSDTLAGSVTRCRLQLPSQQSCWPVVDIVMYVVTDKLTLAFFHEKDTHASQPNRCGDKLFDKKHAISIENLLTSNGLDLPLNNRVFKIFDTQSRSLLLSLPSNDTSVDTLDPQNQLLPSCFQCSQSSHRSNQSSFNLLTIPYGSITFISIQLNHMPYQHHNHHNHQHHQQSPIQPNRLLNNQDTKRHPSLSFSHINESLLKSIQNPCSTGIELQSSSSSTNTANNSISTDIKESLHRACTTEAESASLVETGPNSIPYARRQSSFRSFGYSPISSTNPYSLLKSQSFQVPRRRAFVSTRNTRHSVQLEPTRNHSPTFAQSAKNLCESCGTDSSPEWRRGPSGHKTLCNACGLRYARSVARQGKLVIQQPQLDIGGRGGNTLRQNMSASAKDNYKPAIPPYLPPSPLSASSSSSSCQSFESSVSSSSPCYSYSPNDHLRCPLYSTREISHSFHSGHSRQLYTP